MIRKKVAAVAFGAALGLGTIAATAIPAVASSSSTETQTTVPGGGTTTITLPGIGDLTLTIDPTTGAISDVSLANLDPSIASAAPPVVQPDGSVQIALTLQDGTQQTLNVSGEVESGTPTVETEVQKPETDDESEGDNESEGDDGEHATPPTTGAAPTTGAPSKSGEGRD